MKVGMAKMQAKVLVNKTSVPPRDYEVEMNLTLNLAGFQQRPRDQGLARNTGILTSRTSY